MTGPILASFSMGIFAAVILWAIINAHLQIELARIEASRHGNKPSAPDAVDI